MKKGNLIHKQKILAVMKGKEGCEFTRQKIKEMVAQEYPGTKMSSIMPSDYCYNMRNEGSDTEFLLFQWMKRGVYKYLGEGVKYNGTVSWKGSEYGVRKEGDFKLLK